MFEKLEAYKQYLINMNLSDTYYVYLKILFKYMQENNIKWEELNKDNFTTFIKAHNYSYSATNIHVKAGRNFCKYLGQTDSVFFHIPLLREPQKIPKYITKEELDSAIRNIVTYNSRLSMLKVNALLSLLFYSALSKKELVDLKRKDFDFEEKIVKSYRTKTKTETIHYYPEEVRDKIKRYFESEPEVKNAFNTDISGIDYLFGVISKYLGRKISPHQARHGGARYMHDNGLSLANIQLILGHRNITTTLRYVQADEKGARIEYRKKIG